ncbi:MULTISPECIES: hypothetical protein [Halolamina]|uniref:DUF6199 domain-containing protein n=1 Tax=Halolamina pelagica TaxID=699431 RepID=A0A1I5QCU3_9EURY|nr:MULTISPECIES: hypothetical protein [Halolamina]NHX35194.1 hypothetical protein [Halolamina sp. R1-12]SFP43800.1 hypothetical protein SAMN05216277_103355 [Halolamina pelagica]
MIRELLAVGLGAVLGIVLLVAPGTAIRLSVFGGPTRRRRGDYGTDEPVPDQWRWLARALGLACLAIAAWIGYRTFV